MKSASACGDGKDPIFHLLADRIHLSVRDLVAVLTAEFVRDRRDNLDRCWGGGVVVLGVMCRSPYAISVRNA